MLHILQIHDIGSMNPAKAHIVQDLRFQLQQQITIVFCVMIDKVKCRMLSVSFDIQHVLCIDCPNAPALFQLQPAGKGCTAKPIKPVLQLQRVHRLFQKAGSKGFAFL